MADGKYLLDNAVPAAGTRFEAMAAIFDAWTFQHIERLGIAPGWHCWEVGAGGANVPGWLAERVGPTGRVVATDIDVSWIGAAVAPNVEVRRHDVVLDAPPEGPFDLIHARLVLVHLPDREKALKQMLGALKPGGWLLIEDADPALQPLSVLDPQNEADELANKLRSAFRSRLAGRGANLAFGRTLPRLLREAGLREVSADGYLAIAHPAAAVLERATMAHVRAGLVEDGLATDEEIERHLANVAAGRLTLAQPPLISAWGRR